MSTLRKKLVKKARSGVLQKPFYRKLLLEMARAGIGHVWLMTIDGEDAAFEYVFISHKNYSSDGELSA